MTRSRTHEIRRLTVVIAVLCLVGCAGDGSDDDGGENRIRVFAAASTTDVMARIARAFEEQESSTDSVEVVCNFAASSTLARQIEHGAGADLFLSANPAWMDHLEARGAIDATTRVDLLTNNLALIAPAGRAFPFRFSDDFVLADAFSGRLAMGDPEHVPAGTYARDTMVGLGWWEAIQGRVVPAPDVRAALALVETGAADAGIVYVTDIAASDRVEIVAMLPRGQRDPIRYPVALTSGAGPRTRDFLRFLEGSTARTIFRDAGFTRLSQGRD